VSTTGGEVRIGDLCDTISGLWSGKKPPYEKATVIRNTNFTKDCKLDLSNVAVLDVETKQLQSRRLIPGDLIVEKSGGGPKQAVGRVVLFNESLGTYSLSNFTSALRLRDPLKVLPSYLRYFLYFQYMSGVTETMQSNSTGIRNLNMHQFLGITVPLPPLDKQRKIVEKLEKAFAEIDLAEQHSERIIVLQYDLFRREMQSHLSKWDRNGKVVSLGDVCGIETKLVDPRLKDYRQLLHVGGANIVSKTGELVDLKTASDEALISGKFLFDPSVVLYSKIRPYLMKVARPEFAGLCSADMYPLTPNGSVLARDFLYWTLLSTDFTDYATSGSARAGMPKVNREHLFSYKFFLPDLPEQSRISATLDSLWTELFESGVVVKHKLKLLAKLRESILDASFSGAIK